MKPAIVVVGYNRPKDMERLLNNLNNAEYTPNDIPLIISIDKATNESEVVDVAEKFEWKFGEKIIRTFPERQGLRKHIIQCGDLSNEYGAVIILEDDLMVSPNYYDYVIQALEFYEDEDKVTGIALYSHEWNGYSRRFFVPIADEYDSYMGQFSITWGQCWTNKWWRQFKEWYLDHEDHLANNPLIPSNINHWSDRSWGKYFVNFIVERDLYYVIPRISLSTNCSDIGEHVKNQDNSHQVRLQMARKKNYLFPRFCDAWHYDIYFENKDLIRYLPEFVEKDSICIDLTGLERQNSYRYLLSTRALPFKKLKTYGLQLRPIEMNILWNTPGKEIVLYDTLESAKTPPNYLARVLKYEIRGFVAKDIMVMFTDSMKKTIDSRMKRFRRKKR